MMLSILGSQREISDSTRGKVAAGYAILFVQ